MLVGKKRGREGARKIFDAYLLKQKLPKFDILIEIEEQIEQFGSFLIDDAETIKKGEQFSESSVPIGRNLLYKSCNILLKENTSAAYIKRSVFVTNFSATGKFQCIS